MILCTVHIHVHCIHTFIQADLKKLGISNYGDLETGQLGNCANDKLELFVDEFVSYYSYVAMYIL